MRSVRDSIALIHRGEGLNGGVQGLGVGLQRVLVVQAGKDEIVPAELSERVFGICRENLATPTRGSESDEGGKSGDEESVDGEKVVVEQIKVEKVVVPGALHTDVMIRPGGRAVLVEFLRRVF